jgi:REP element-mobilizing transposase RayT
MSDKFQNKYRIPSARLQNWDYGWNAAYFITICTQNRECYSGKIIGEKMFLSEIGTVVQQYWNEIPTHFPFVELGEFVVMPNHVHGIIVINKPDDGRYIETSIVETTPSVIETRSVIETPSVVETPKLGVSTIAVNEIIPTNETIPAIITNEIIPATAIIPTNRTAAASEKWNPGTLGVILNQYKRICTIHAREIHADYGWQSRFHDHIIRNDESFQRISEYIRNNQLNWCNDKFFNGTEP